MSYNVQPGFKDPSANLKTNKKSRVKCDDDDEDSSSSSFKIISKPKSSSIHDVYISQSLSEASNYESLFNLFRSASSQDIINMYLGSPGGLVSTGVQLINSIKDSSATVNMIVDTPCYSMASVLALTGSSLTFNNHTMLMFHNYSGGAYGRGAELMCQIKAHQEWVYTLFNEVCSPFLTDDEIDYIFQDGNIYINSWDKNLKARIKRHFKK
jgi:ATP-dependent protease ClpP protease subunit